MPDMLPGVDKPLIGMVHLRPLPGSPSYEGDMSAVIESALRDARALEEGGADALLVENIGDRPFSGGRVGPATVAAMAVVAARVAEETSLPMGVSVLRNDCFSAMGIAGVVGARFIRCNAYVEVLATDQGIIQPQARRVVAYRRYLGSSTLIFADVLCKHATPLHEMSVEETVRAAFDRGLADAVIITGRETGRPPRIDDLKAARAAAGERPILVGSGVTAENAKDLLRLADGAIVGTYLKRGGKLREPVDVERVRRLAEVFREVRGSG